MQESKSTYQNINEYINTFSPQIREKLQQIRLTIMESAPDAQEAISYQMPTFKLYGNLVHFGAAKNHIGFYPAPSGIEAFKDEFDRLGYSYSKGAVQFPQEKPMPLDLIRRIVEFRVKENISKKKK